ITGARVEASLDNEICHAWKTFQAKKGSVLRIKSVKEGFRYYIGFSGMMDIEEVMGSFTTNTECAFGGYNGRALKKGDTIQFKGIKDVENKEIDERLIPSLKPPHILRIIEGPEIGFFDENSLKTLFENREKKCYKVSVNSNRIGIRLEGNPLKFKERVEKSIVSEGILPGTIQVPGDGLPLIMLYERTIGGYARLASVIKADLFRLAHLKPGDDVFFEMVTLDEAIKLWQKRCTISNELFKK
ncbi:MAG: biotin-dependent carboxyltransferase family protein, partial [Syntrophorhabdaceae bacterium]|nr:biotin-dependent carboxyltransferase family protein [Syntrophorhabdaceae bacterium]